MSLAATSFRIHRWLGWLIGLQVLVWVASGTVFSLLPFQAWVKGADQVRAPRLVLPTGWAERSSAALQAASTDRALRAISAVATPHGAALKLLDQAGGTPLLVPLDGSPWRAPGADAVRDFARTLYLGTGTAFAVERLATVPRRLGIVAETGGRGNLWKVSFDDALATRIYFDGHSGEFVISRNEAWIWYDFLWRLHIMDYLGGEDFNSKLLRFAAIGALGLAASGAVLSVLAVQRRWRAQRRRRRRTGAADRTA